MSALPFWPRWPLLPDPFDIPSAPQRPLQMERHIGLAWGNIGALEGIARDLQAELAECERRMLAANTGHKSDWPAFDAAADDFALADKELAVLLRRIEELE